MALLIIVEQCLDSGGTVSSICCPKRCDQQNWLIFVGYCLFYKIFVCLVLKRIEHQLDDHQPEEQHGFPRRKRIEKHRWSFPQQKSCCWYSTMVCKPKFRKSIWSCSLASTFEKFVWTRHDFEVIRRVIWDNLDRSSDWFRLSFRSKKNIYTSIAPCDKDVFWALVSSAPCYSLPCGSGHWKFWFVGWDAASHWHTLGHWSGETVGYLGDLLRSRNLELHRSTEMIGLYVHFARIGTTLSLIGNTISNRWQKRIMPTRMLEDRGVACSLFRCCSFIGYPCTTNTYKPWAFISEVLPIHCGYSAAHWVHTHVACKRGIKEQHILLASRNFRLGPKFVVTLCVWRRNPETAQRKANTPDWRMDCESFLVKLCCWGYRMVEPVQVSSVTVVWTTKSRLTIATKRLWGFGP